jgi:dolichol-phosphate mannosyltransferase
VSSLIILPTYNERDNISLLIKEILNLNLDCQILVVDDNSPDKTAQAVQEIAEKDGLVHIIQRERKLGLGTAYIEGFRYALKRGFDFVFEMDADFSHSPRYLPIFLERIKDYDLIIGSRYIKGGQIARNLSRERKFLSHLANIYARLLTGIPLKDLTSGFKCFRKEVLQSIDFEHIESDGYSFQIEVNFICWQKEFRICEIPIAFEERRAGISKMSRKIAKEANTMLWRIALQRLRRRKLPVSSNKNKCP